MPADAVDKWKDTVAGSLAGMAQVVVGQPLDTVKVRLQVEDARSAKFRGPLHCIVDTVRQEGFLALYKGMAAPLVGISAVNALLFTAYSSFKDVQVRMGHAHTADQLSLSAIALAGAGAGFVNSILASPVELLKVRLQVQRSLTSKHQTQQQYRGPTDLARALVHTDGWRHGLFRGFWATVWREIPAYAAFYAAFEAAKRRITGAGQAGPETLVAAPWQLMLAGSTAGVSYWCACYPLDVIKSRAQNSNKRLRSGYMTEITRAIYRAEGLAGFWRGFTPCVLRSIPSAAVTFTTYELVMRMLD
ncbi:mitochondrial carrier domain-containing protein [Thamnocephalis sphaerospora]|uniref:Mitochondrial carrier domain-containing protein n=1 Tax=Thamnocephalis sphaerospora TaxID=78915 RepID=A0A4P9XLM8_9FUNG|nr:mitochondrial carrier domain-containing protein [Thamnocephalis sphaerospora]|eukprot:RKP06716.1 mitochondrial carrier domain-containing protein [Thamnocephalis sphaerospora]